MKLKRYLEIQKKEFIEWGPDLNKKIVIAADSLNSLKKYYDTIDANVYQYKDNNSYIVELKDGTYHLFIKGSYKGYRARFKNFLHEKHNISKRSVPQHLNVDHVFSKGRAKGHYIRMILLDQKANKAWGSSYEKSMTSIMKNRSSHLKDLIFLDFSLFLKIMELPSFKKIHKDKDGNINLLALKQIARETRLNLEDILGPNPTIPLDAVEKFFRAEIHETSGGSWTDPDPT